MAEKNIKTMSIEEIGTELMGLKNASEGIEARIRALINEAEERGYAGKNIPTKGGVFVVALTKGEERRYNQDKGVDVLGAEVIAQLLATKQRKVKLTLSDFGTMIDDEIKDKISDVVKTTIKATVRKNKD